MAKQTKPKKKSNRGGPRANSGRKPKELSEVKQRLISGMAEITANVKNDAAVYAFNLYDETMRDKNERIATRLECANEILNRVWGKSTERHESKTETTHVFLSQFSAALEISYGKPDDPPNALPTVVNGNGHAHSV